MGFTITERGFDALARMLELCERKPYGRGTWRLIMEEGMSLEESRRLKTDGRRVKRYWARLGFDNHMYVQLLLLVIASAGEEGLTTRNVFETLERLCGNPDKTPGGVLNVIAQAPKETGVETFMRLLELGLVCGDDRGEVDPREDADR